MFKKTFLSGLLILTAATPALAKGAPAAKYPAAAPVIFNKPKPINYSYKHLVNLAKKKPVKNISSAPETAPASVKNSVVPAKTIAISLKQITLIKAPAFVKSVIYSKASRLQVVHNGDNVFVSILPIKKTYKDGRVSYVYSKSPKGIYINTATSIYVLNLVPANIPAQTVFLSPQSGIGGNPLVPSANANITGKPATPLTVIKRQTVIYNPQSSYVKNNIRLVEDGFLQKIPAGFSLVNIAGIKHKKIEYKQADVALQSLMANGYYSIYTFIVKAKKDIRLTESEFLSLVQKPLAVSIITPVLKTYQTTRVIIVSAATDKEDK